MIEASPSGEQPVPVFELRGIGYRYHGSRPALDRVDLSIEEGEQVVILGANGCGKSTLLKLLDGLYRPTEGSFLAWGEDVTGIADEVERGRRFHQLVGLVFQDPDVQLFSPTVYDDVAFGPLQLGWPDDDVRSRVDAALAEMNVEHLADRAPYELSGGEKKRVAIASVLSMDPEVVLLDEPTANLDPRSRSVLVETVIRLGEIGKTVIVTTHELDIVPAIASRVVVFGDAEHRPVASGSAAEILADRELLLRTNLIHETFSYVETGQSSASD